MKLLILCLSLLTVGGFCKIDEPCTVQSNEERPSKPLRGTYQRRGKCIESGRAAFSKVEPTTALRLSGGHDSSDNESVQCCVEIPCGDNGKCRNNIDGNPCKKGNYLPNLNRARNLCPASTSDDNVQCCSEKIKDNTHSGLRIRNIILPRMCDDMSPDPDFGGPGCRGFGRWASLWSALAPDGGTSISTISPPGGSLPSFNPVSPAPDTAAAITPVAAAPVTPVPDPAAALTPVAAAPVTPAPDPAAALTPVAAAPVTPAPDPAAALTPDAAAPVTPAPNTAAALTPVAAAPVTPAPDTAANNLALAPINSALDTPANPAAVSNFDKNSNAFVTYDPSRDIRNSFQNPADQRLRDSDQGLVLGINPNTQLAEVGGQFNNIRMTVSPLQNTKSLVNTLVSNPGNTFDPGFMLNFKANIP